MDDRVSHYYDALERVHRHLRPETYLEIGVDQGLSLRFVGTDTIAVGVDPALGADVIARYPDIDLRETTSDAFFSSGDAGAAFGGRSIDLAFIDGMHRFENALRDVANVASHSHGNSVALVHDCLPTDAICASRERETIAWAGDVWKVPYVLRRELPGLGVHTVDAEPTGLGVISGLADHSDEIHARLEELIERYVHVSYDAFAADPSDAVGVVPADWTTMQSLLPTPFSPS